MPQALNGIRVVELAGIGPAPVACMILADLGAEVVRVVRPPELAAEAAQTRHTLRGRTIVAADLKLESDAEFVRSLIGEADVLVEGFRPGVTERLGLGPEEMLARNPGLVYARMTGWGQTGPWAARAGHDINYLAVSGALHAIGPRATPAVPLNLVADYGAGSMFLVSGILAAIVQRTVSGRGQVVDAAMIDGLGILMQDIWKMYSGDQWKDVRQSNLLDGGAPFYRCYTCSDGGHMAVGALEPQFYAQFVTGLGLSPLNLPAQSDETGWPELHETFSAAFRQKPRSHWETVFERLDACVTPVLSMAEVINNPQVASRRSVLLQDGVVEGNEAPRLSESNRAAGGTRSRTNELLTAVERWSPSKRKPSPITMRSN